MDRPRGPEHYGAENYKREAELQNKIRAAVTYPIIVLAIALIGVTVMVTYVVPTLALVWGAVDGEVITTRQLLAMAGVLGMVALVQFGGAENAKPRAAGGKDGEPHFCPSENPVDGVIAEPAGGEISRG